MTVNIPESIADVNAQWLAEATGFDIKSISIEQIGVGIGVSSAVYRIKLEGNNCPASVVVKLPALDEAAVFTSSILRMYIREQLGISPLHSERLYADVPVVDWRAA